MLSRKRVGDAMNKIETIDNYKTIVFDCDGVVLDSNKVKTQAFYNTALAFGKAAANRLVKHHIERGGISRYEKFRWFIENLEAEELAQYSSGPDLDRLLENYAKEVRKGLRRCEIAEGLEQLREQTSNSIWMIVSGGDQNELRELFAERCIAELFDGGIYGSPDTKESILNRERKRGNIVNKALFLGDSKYDYEAAKTSNLDFIFLYKWTEFSEYEHFFSEKPVRIYQDIQSLL